MEFSVEYRATGSLSFVSLYVPLGAWVDTGNRIRPSLFGHRRLLPKTRNAKQLQNAITALLEGIREATTYSNNYCSPVQEPIQLETYHTEAKQNEEKISFRFIVGI